MKLIVVPFNLKLIKPLTDCCKIHISGIKQNNQDNLIRLVSHLSLA